MRPTLHQHARNEMTSVSLLVASDAMWRGRAKRFAAGIAALILFSILQYGFSDRGSPRAVMLTGLAWTAAALLAVQQTLQTARHFGGRDRLVWSGLALACIAWLGGRLYADYWELVRGETLPFP